MNKNQIEFLLYQSAKEMFTSRLSYLGKPSG